MESLTIDNASRKVSQDQPGDTSLTRDVAYLFAKIALVILAVVILLTFVYGVSRIDGGSMRPTMQDGDVVLFYRLDKTYVSGDVVLVNYRGETQARRVVAIAGDVVDMAEGRLVVNGAAQQEPSIFERTERYERGIDFPFIVGEGQVFLLADARETGTDSRVYGAANVEDTQGKVITLIRRRSI